MATSQPPPDSKLACWKDVAYRSPRPGFFLGDDRAVTQASPLLNDKNLPSSYDLGRLHVLPLELLHAIVAELAEADLVALVALRNCNRATADVVDGFRDFATVAAFPRALTALVRLASPSSSNTAPVSLHALAVCLRTVACASCLRHGHSETDVPIGDCIYLLSPERVCYACFRSRPEYLPVVWFATDTKRPAQLGAADCGDSNAPRLTSLRVPPGRYGVLAQLTQPVDLFDRRQVFGEGVDRPDLHATAAGLIDVKRGTMAPSRPDPLRYAAVIPGPYWEPPSEADSNDAAVLDRGYACRACAQTDHNGAGWADPLARYTRAGLQRHLDDARYGGRVLQWEDPRWPGATLFQHNSPRQKRFPTPPEYGATADLARRREAVVLVPERSVVSTRF